tara:strand:- start:880 stop:1281 length:402 start_codon:yes stop_codon:yes gene_type:complete
MNPDEMNQVQPGSGDKFDLDLTIHQIHDAAHGDLTKPVMFDDYFDAVPGCDGDPIKDTPDPDWPEDHIWALIECDEDDHHCIMADPDWRHRFVNRLGYICSVEPHTIGNTKVSNIKDLEIYWVHESDFDRDEH